jgi:RNA polymerase sigma factor (sigma-70 family)
MADAKERAIREALLRGEASDDQCNELVDLLAEPLRRKIRATFYRYTYSSNEQECDDVLQSTFCKIIENLHQCAPEKSLLPWAKTIASHEVINVLRERTKQRRISSGAAASKDTQHTSPQKTDMSGETGTLESQETEAGQLDAWDIEELAGLHEEDEEAEGSYTYDYGDAELAGSRKSEIFRNELALLSNSEQTIIIDHYQNGRPLVDLAKEFGISDEAMRQRAHRARMKLYQRLVQYEEFHKLKKLNESAARQKT